MRAAARVEPSRCGLSSTRAGGTSERGGVEGVAVETGKLRVGLLAGRRFLGGGEMWDGCCSTWLVGEGVDLRRGDEGPWTAMAPRLLTTLFTNPPCRTIHTSSLCTRNSISSLKLFI